MGHFLTQSFGQLASLVRVFTFNRFYLIYFNYISSAKEVMFPLPLVVFFVCIQNNSKSSGWISLKLSQNLPVKTIYRRFNFGIDPAREGF